MNARSMLKGVQGMPAFFSCCRHFFLVYFATAFMLNTFIFQDCQVLCCYHGRASYYPAPYVDDHGEKHKHHRGKPLYLDIKR